VSLISTTFEFKNLFSLNKKEIAKENRIKVEKLLVTESRGKGKQRQTAFSRISGEGLPLF